MTLADTIGNGIAELDDLLGTALAAAVVHPAALVFTDLPLDFGGKRDIAFAIGLLDEGENEAALIAALARDTLRRTPGADIAHLTREAWYYLRTSIDPTWQFDDGEPSLPAALAYLAHVLRERTEIALRSPHEPLRDAVPAAERAVLLRTMRG